MVTTTTSARASRKQFFHRCRLFELRDRASETIGILEALSYDLREGAGRVDDHEARADELVNVTSLVLAIIDAIIEPAIDSLVIRRRIIFPPAWEDFLASVAYAATQGRAPPFQSAPAGVRSFEVARVRAIVPQVFKAARILSTDPAARPPNNDTDGGTHDE
jgi:hypothetical protein